MISLETFLLALMIVSTATSLVTEAIKKILTEHNISYRANTLAGIVAAILSAIIGVGYIIFTGTPFTAKIAVCLVALIVMGWLCAMVGYDKVVGQIKKNQGE